MKISSNFSIGFSSVDKPYNSSQTLFSRFPYLFKVIIIDSFRNMTKEQGGTYSFFVDLLFVGLLNLNTIL
nr:MAG TPA: hypothetical protein [Caudoviricetes sp.]